MKQYKDNPVSSKLNSTSFLFSKNKICTSQRVTMYLTAQNINFIVYDLGIGFSEIAAIR